MNRRRAYTFSYWDVRAKWKNPVSIGPNELQIAAFKCHIVPIIRLGSHGQGHKSEYRSYFRFGLGKMIFDLLISIEIETYLTGVNFEADLRCYLRNPVGIYLIQKSSDHFNFPSENCFDNGKCEPINLQLKAWRRSSELSFERAPRRWLPLWHGILYFRHRCCFELLTANFRRGFTLPTWWLGS